MSSPNGHNSVIPYSGRGQWLQKQRRKECLKVKNIFGCIADGSLNPSCVFSCLLESCFRFSLTHRKPPLFCQQGYLKQQGVAHNSQMWQHVHDAGMIVTEQDAGTSGTNAAFSNYLAQAGASLSSGLKLDFWLFLPNVVKLCLCWKLCCLCPSDCYLQHAKQIPPQDQIFLTEYHPTKQWFPTLWAGYPLKQSSFYLDTPVTWCKYLTISTKEWFSFLNA